MSQRELEILPNLEEIQAEIEQRQGDSLADQNRDSALFLRILGQLTQHIKLLGERIDPLE